MPSAMPRGMIVTLCTGIAVRRQPADDRVARFVIRRVLFFFLRHHERLALRPDQNAIDRFFAIRTSR